MGFLFVQKLFSVNTRVRILIFCRAKRAFFFLEFNIMLYDKNSEWDYIFFPPSKSEYFFSKIGNQNIFLRKNP